MRIKLEEKVFYSYFDDIICSSDNEPEDNEMYKRVLETFKEHGELDVDNQNRIMLYLKSGTILFIRNEAHHTATYFHGLDLDISLEDIRMTIL